MQFDYPHSFAQDEAQARVTALCDYLNNRHGIMVQWQDNKASFDGKYLLISISGQMSVDSDAIRFEGKDPGMLWRKKAMSYLRDKLELYLDANTPVSELPRDAN